MKSQNYFVYILTNADRHTVLYVGVTNDLEPRASDHSLGRGSAFAKQYNANKLVYFESIPGSAERDWPRKAAQKLESREKRRADCKREPRVAHLFEDMYSLKGK